MICKASVMVGGCGKSLRRYARGGRSPRGLLRRGGRRGEQKIILTIKHQIKVSKILISLNTLCIIYIFSRYLALKSNPIVQTAIGRELIVRPYADFSRVFFMTFYKLWWGCFTPIFSVFIFKHIHFFNALSLLTLTLIFLVFSALFFSNFFINSIFNTLVLYKNHSEILEKFILDLIHNYSDFNTEFNDNLNSDSNTHSGVIFNVNKGGNSIASDSDFIENKSIFNFDLKFVKKSIKINKLSLNNSINNSINSSINKTFIWVGGINLIHHSNFLMRQSNKLIGRLFSTVNNPNLNIESKTFKVKWLKMLGVYGVPGSNLTSNLLESLFTQFYSGLLDLNIFCAPLIFFFCLL